MADLRQTRTAHGVYGDQFHLNRRGTMAIEMALILLPFLMLTSGVLEFGRYFWIQHALEYGCERGAEYVYAHSTNPDIAAVKQQVREAATGLDQSMIEITTTSSTINDGAALVITAKYPFVFLGLLEMPRWKMGDERIASTMTVPIE